MRSLGRLPEAQKTRFISFAEKVLAEPHYRVWPGFPDKDAAKALDEVAHLADALADALRRVERFPQGYVHPGWRPLVRRIASLARRSIPESDRPAHRPTDQGPRTLVIIVLAASFEQAFGALPAIGSGSPFVKFVQLALPEYGFDEPSLGKLRNVVDLMASAPTKH
jgi:hypothetical protein